MTDTDILSFAKLPNLRCFAISDAKVSGSAFASGFRFLEELALSNCPVTDASAAQLARLPALRKLKLSQTPLTEQGIKTLLTNKTLTELSLYDCQLHDESIETLAKLASLKHVELRQMRLSLNGLHKLKTLLPNCELYPDPDALEKLVAESNVQPN
jgi:internalin A